MHPVLNRSIGTQYGTPGNWGLGYHPGVDYPCPSGTTVVAPASGYIRRVAWDKFYGNYLILRTTINGKALDVYLCHLTRSNVKAGQVVKIGQNIAVSGYTGNVRPKGPKGAHVHMEVRVAGGGYNKRDIINPSIVYKHQEKAVSLAPVAPLSIPVCVWNIARPRWYTPWKDRVVEVQRELQTTAAKVFMFQELFEESVIATIAQVLPNCQRVAGRAGLEFFFDKNQFKLISSENVYSGIANRWLQHIDLEDRATGIRISFLNCHAPIKAEGSTAKARYGQFVVRVEKTTKYKTVIAGDFNVPDDSSSPKKEIRAAGYIGFKEQAAITNENVREFIPKRQDLCDIRTRKGRISGGEVDVSTNSLESDHRKISATVVIAA